MDKVVTADYIRLLQRVSLHLKLTLKNNKLGKKRSSSKGSSVEFSDYREYIPGDDYRRIDWNALARFEKVFIKLYMDEQESPVTIFLDQSRSMDFAKKREVSIKIAALFAFASLADYDTVTTVLHNDHITERLAGVRGSTGFSRIVAACERTKYSGASNLASVIKANFKTRSQGISVIISDLLFDHQLDEILSYLHFHKQKVIICHVLSAEELTPNLTAHHRLLDSENQSEIDVDQSEETQQIYQEALNHYLADIKGHCERYHANYFLVNALHGAEPFVYQLTKHNMEKGL